MTVTEYPAVQPVVAAMKAEILDLIKDGTVPETVSSFSELHDYIDANMLAEDLFPSDVDFYDDDATEAHFARVIEVLNPAQDEVNVWLHRGRPAELRLTVHATVEAEDFAAFLKDHENLADVADSFNARLNEVFGSGPEVLVTVRVQSIAVEE